ncbi:family 78 glycoside hydrolase catalytic domain [Actinopolymorpha sp. B17G11]|uniref:family 78 glycoside hydrolase catalytic domain n=1 Tax=Actinopolymorpha sp. B17G11 TaxID=3160861 RepID=UPI0032E3EC17
MTAAVRPHTLRTEYAENPVGLEEPAPRFSWLLATTPAATTPAATGTRRTDYGSQERGSRGSAAGQSAYQIRVASSVDVLLAGGSDVWDSGPVESRRSAQVEYAGQPLRSATPYLWTVRVWDAAGEASEWSDPASFEMGLLSPDDWGGATWIGHPASWSAGGLPNGGAAEALPAPLLRTAFRLSRGDSTGSPPVRARLYACGLGYGEYYLDGHRIGRAVLDPAPTNYDATVLYSTYDVTDLLAAGPPGAEHVLAAHLGRGRYGEPTTSVWYWEQAPWWDHPKLLAQLVVSYADGRVQRIVTDPTWRSIDGPVRVDSLFAGERYDARHEQPGWTERGFDDSGWSPAAAVAPPKGALRAQQVEPIEPVAEIAPVALTSPRPGVFVFDVGQQIAGWARLRLSGPAGTEVTISYGEKLRADGTVETDQQLRLIDADIQTDAYVLRGGDVETYEPRFSYKGFQFVQVEYPVDGVDSHGKGSEPYRPALADLRAIVVHTSVASTGEFLCDDELVNRLHSATRWAILNNLHGVPTDTPVFEKNGWTGDAHLTAGAAAHNFHMPRFYTKWLQDWVDAQMLSGEFPPIIPTSGWGYHGDSRSAIAGPIPAWEVAYVEILWTMYMSYGDERILSRHYDHARRYLDYLVDGYVDDDVVLVGLGDWLPPDVGGAPPEGPGIYETAYTWRYAALLAAIAAVIGRDGDIPAYEELQGRLRSGFNRAFFDAAAGIYHGEKPAGYRQAANVIALSFGLVPHDVRPRVFGNLVADIHARQDHLDTGVIGTKLLFPLLTANGEVDLAFRAATQRTYPGYGFWIEQGATSLYEHWGADSRSRNHHFFGHVDQWFVEDLAGLSPSAPGYATVRVRPVPPQALGHAYASIDTIRGRVATSWRRRDDGYELRVELPPGVTGEVYLPRAAGGHEDARECGEGVHIFT